MLLAGFLMHPNLLAFVLLETVEQLVMRFHNQQMYQIEHFIVMFTIDIRKETLNVL